jgi:hypothetical protein
MLSLWFSEARESLYRAVATDASKSIFPASNLYGRTRERTGGPGLAPEGLEPQDFRITQVGIV